MALGMSDLPPDPSRLQTILAYLERQITENETIGTYLRLQRDDVRKALSRGPAAPSREDAARGPGSQGQPPATERHAERARPSAPAWFLDRGPHQALPPITVHVGNCWAASPRAQEVDRDAARQALSDGVEACSACRPDAKLDALG
ncbi:DUF6233 domain-containing protein [Streptomyces sp. F-1]|uniref:DUF6233 domain-containing protein n=1 Tax=Streptomyces sp. F-1 TaxID=463642 RepID=UPI0009A10EFF|nr:DUF6233 domain-containing protein [Streptomyces sp. F-1]